MNELLLWLNNLHDKCKKEWHLGRHSVSDTVWIYEFNKMFKN